MSPFLKLISWIWRRLDYCAYRESATITITNDITGRTFEHKLSYDEIREVMQMLDALSKVVR